jgi:beta-glucosidase
MHSLSLLWCRQEMPDSTYFGDALRGAVNDKSVPQSRLDDMVTRILRSMYQAGLADTPQTGEHDAHHRHWLPAV